MTQWSEFRFAWRLARRELRSGLRSFGVFLLCLFLGSLAISAVGSFSAAVDGGIRNDARAILGGDLELRRYHRPLSSPEREYLAAAGTLSEVLEMRAMARRIGSGEESLRSTLVELKAVDGAYPLFGTLEIQPPGDLHALLAPRDGFFGALVEDSLLHSLGVALGDKVDLGDSQFEIRGVLRREPDRALRAFNLGPRFLVNVDGLQASGLVLPGSLVRYLHRLRLPVDRPVEELGADLTRRFPESGWRIRNYHEAAPRVRRIVDRLAGNLTLVGLTALLVGGLGVSGAVRGYLSGKLHNLAVMRSVGAPSRLLFRAYLLQILLLGVIGAGGGVLAGASVPFLLTPLLPDSFPLPLRAALYPLPLAVAGASGLLIALVFSLTSLGRAGQVSPTVLFRTDLGATLESATAGVPRRVRGAVATLAIALVLLAGVAAGDRRLALWFTVGTLACFALFHLLGTGVVLAARRAPRVPWLALRLGLANLHRPGNMTRAAVFALGVGLTALVAVAQVEGNMAALVGRSIPERAPTFFVIDLQQDQVDEFDRIAAASPDVLRSERVATLRGRITHINGVPSDQARIDPEVQWAVRGDRFLTTAADAPANAVVTAGSWWAADYQGPPLLSLTADLAEGFGVSLGDTLTVNVLGRDITATLANFRDVDWSTLELNFAVILSPGPLEKAPKTYLGSVYAQEGREEEALQALTAPFPNLSAVRVREVLENVTRVLERLAFAFRGMAGLTLTVGLLVLAGAVSAEQRRRLLTAVLYKVCGATRLNILAAFAAEFLLLGVAVGAISVVTGSLAAFGLVRGLMDSAFQLQPGAAALTVLLGVCLSLGLGLVGTARVLGRKPAQFLRNE